VLDTSFSRLVLDISKVPTISQRGIEALLGFRNKSKKRDLEIEIHGIHPIVSQTLKELGLEKAFKIR
ncbi:MAG TPA: STAS domain-containing protein, partial [bacterium]